MKPFSALHVVLTGTKRLGNSAENPWPASSANHPPATLDLGSSTAPPSRTMLRRCPTSTTPPQSAGGSRHQARSSTSTLILDLALTAGHQWTTTIGGSVEAGIGTTTPQAVIPLAGDFCAGADPVATLWDGDLGGTDPTVWNGGRPPGTGVRQACTTSHCHRLCHRLCNSAGMR